LIVAAYTVGSGIALDFAFTGWVEATDATFTGTVVGFVVPRGHRPKIDPQGRRSRDVQVAVDTAAQTFSRGSWRLALLDVHAAYLAVGGDDSFVFAYRAIEDLARAVSPTAKKSWPHLNTHLGLTKQQLQSRTRRLFNARNAAAHGDLNDAALLAARAAHARTIGLPDDWCGTLLRASRHSHRSRTFGLSGVRAGPHRLRGGAASTPPPRHCALFRTPAKASQRPDVGSGGRSL
jgi:hypothetical protein